jgi:uncharacterized protein YndB with AHSA1/START domain
MKPKSNPGAARTVQALTITRVFDAPRELVWSAFTDPVQLSRWWGPKDFTAPVWTTDFRVGGRYHYCMRGPDGTNYWGTGVYREIVPLERIVYTDSFSDDHGNPIPASQLGFEGDWPMEMLVTLTFEDAPRGTKFTLRHEGLPAGAMRDMAGTGWNESFDKLAALLAGA